MNLQLKMNTEELIYKNLQEGVPFRTPENKIIPVTEAEIQRFKGKVYANRSNIQRRFTKLYNEFEDYINNRRKNKLTNNTFVIEPLPQTETSAETNRVSLYREAKSSVLDGHYKGQSTSNSDGNKKIKKRKVKFFSMPLFFYI